MVEHFLFFLNISMVVAEGQMHKDLTNTHASQVGEPRQASAACDRLEQPTYERDVPCVVVVQSLGCC